MIEPRGLESRPHVGGFPVPFITAVIDGKPDFKTHDEYLRSCCASFHLCQLCGLPLGTGPLSEGSVLVAFTGFARSIERRTFGEPPAHPECLAYAFEVCPWLNGKTYALHGETRRIEPPAEPERMGILITDRWWLTDDDEGVSDFKFKAGDPAVIEWRNRAREH